MHKLFQAMRKAPSSEGAEHSKMFVAFLLLLKFLPKGSRKDTALMYSGPIISNHWSIVLVTGRSLPSCSSDQAFSFPRRKIRCVMCIRFRAEGLFFFFLAFSRLSFLMEIILCAAFCEAELVFFSLKKTDSWVIHFLPPVEGWRPA